MMGPGRGGGGRGGPGAGAADARKPKNTKETLRKLLGLVAEFKWGFIVVIVLAVLTVLCQVLGPYLMGLATNEVAAGIQRLMAKTGGMDMTAMLRILLILGGVYLASALFTYLQSYVLAGVTQKLMYRLRQRIQRKLRFLPLSYFDTNTLGDVLSRVTNDVDTVSTSLQNNLPNFFTSLLTLVLVLVAMLLLSPLLTLVGLVTLPLSFLFSMQTMKRSQGYFRGQQKGLGDLGGYIEEMFTGHDVIRAYGQEKNRVEDFDRINDELYGNSRKAQFISGLIMPVTFFFTNIGYVLVAVLGGVAVIQGTLPIGSIQSFIQYLRQFSQPISQISNMVNEVQATIAAAERVFQFLEEPEESPGPLQPKRIADPRGEVRMEHVRFGYSPNRVLIHDLSIDLRSGDKIALVGPTGAGKTTLVNLLLRFYDVQGGRITIDGVDIMEMTRHDLREMFGMVLQDTWLFSGTIEENIRYGRLNATDEEVRAAAKAAYADAFIRALPGGYQMDLGEDAGTLSGGQRQLLTIARAVLSDPTILILDEATSSVDTRTEVLIQKAMARLMENRTSFVIAHRLSTIRDSQMIMVLNDGDIVETGNHEELMAKDGFYAKLYNSQLAGIGEEEGA
ncbi:MAG: ABC transporter ATP-binding protein [Oscillospiraceae bacterium]